MRRSSFSRGVVNDTSASTSATPRVAAVVCATRLLFVSAANQVYAALSDGNLVFCNVTAVAQHLPSLADTDDMTAAVEHKCLAQTLMQVCSHDLQF